MSIQPLISHIRKLLNNLLPVLILLLVSFLLWQHGDMGIDYDWHWNRVWRYFGHYSGKDFVAGPLLTGIWLTISITVAGLILSILCALLAVALRLSPWPLCVFIAKVYIALWRATPLLIQLFMAYFLISPLLKLSPFWTAVLALSLFEGACFAEIFRAGILSVHKNQWEAALSLGFDLGQTFLLVILPQATRNVLPMLTNQAVALLKDSTLVSAIAVADLTMQSQTIVAETFLAFETWLLAGAIYLLLALFITLPGLCLEKLKPVKRNLP